MKNARIWIGALGLSLAMQPLTLAQPGVIAPVRQMPDIPQPFEMRDWRQVAIDFDHIVFDPSASGQYLPLLHLMHDPSGKVTGFGMPTYVGDERQAEKNDWEALAVMGSVWGSTLVGIDKAHGPHDYVEMLKEFYDPHLHMMGNNIGHTSPQDTFWYTLFPNVLFASICDHYADHIDLLDLQRQSALAWAKAANELSDPKHGDAANFDYTGFNFTTKKGIDNGKWKEPDAGAGVAWVELAAYERWHDPVFLKAADQSLRYLDQRPADQNPFYEILMPFGALAAVRANAELGRNYDTAKLIDWCFTRGVARPDWQMNHDRWGNYDTAGLMGGTDCPPWREGTGGYGFSMNTFGWAWALVPVARYDPRYAHDLGKWMLNAANAARLYYSNALPPQQQTCPDWKGDPNHAIAYEGLKYRWDDPNQGLVSGGDPVHMQWGPKTDFALYGGAYAGVFGALIARTEDPQILRLDLLATDACRPKAYPSYLFYNPHPESRKVSLDVGGEARDVYDAANGSFLDRGKTGAVKLEIPADGAIVVVLPPANGKLATESGTTRVNGVVIDYRRGEK